MSAVAIDSTVEINILIIDLLFCLCFFFFRQFSSNSVAAYRSDATSSPTMEDATEEYLWRHEAHAVECLEN